MDAPLAQRQDATPAPPHPSQPARVPDGYEFENGHLVPYWYTREGFVVKWAIFLSLIGLFILYVAVGYFHAKKRIRAGLVPLAYHRWLISRAELARVDPRYAADQGSFYYASHYRPGYYQQYQPGFNMASMPPPPPMYDPRAARPPVYQGPAGESKAPEAQAQAQEPPPAAPPPGPPPQARQ